jgi:hypothetical protein
MSKFDDFKKGLKKAFDQDPEARKNFRGTAAVTAAFAGATAGFAASRGKPVAALAGAIVGGYYGYKGAGKVLEDLDGTGAPAKKATPSPDPFAGAKRGKPAKPEAGAAEGESDAAKPAKSPRRRKGGPGAEPK